MKNVGLSAMLMLSDEVIWREKNGETTWETSYQCFTIRKVKSKKVATGGRFHFFLDSDEKHNLNNIA